MKKSVGGTWRKNVEAKTLRDLEIYKLAKFAI